MREREKMYILTKAQEERHSTILGSVNKRKRHHSPRGLEKHLQAPSMLIRDRQKTCLPRHSWQTGYSSLKKKKEKAYFVGLTRH